MLSQELRPNDWEEMAGQKENINILKAIIRNPEESPRCLIFQGAYGSGKTTSARILARKLNKVTDSNFDLLSSPFYYEFDSTVVGNVEEIRKLGDMFKMNYGDYWRVIVFDECLSGDTLITLADGSTKTIKEIVDNKLNVKVMSYNISTGNVEPKKVVGWFENSPKIFYSVRTTKQKGIIRVSDNHRFITPEGEKTLKELSIGSKVYRFEHESMNVIEDSIQGIQVYNTSVAPSYDIEVEDNHNYFGGGILVHNCHAVSTAAQTALLKILEEAEGHNLFIMCTTHIHKVLPTIRSRSLELKFENVPDDEIVRNLSDVCQKRNIDIPDDIKLLIADRSGGHMRNAHMLLDKYLLLGEEDFKDSIKSSISLYCDFFVAIHNEDKEGILNSINGLMNIPRDDLQSDFNIVMTESMRGFCGYDVRHADIQRMLDVYKQDFSVVVSCYMSTWIKNAFIDMPYFQATMLNMCQVIRNALKKSSAQATQSTSSNVAQSRFGAPIRR